MNEPTINPQSAVLILKHEGREVGRIAATAPNATDYINELARHYGSLTSDFRPQGT